MTFTIYKRNHHGNHVLSYTGELIERGETWVCIRAIFQFSDRDLGYMTINRGDIFTEWFYADRWYNIFRVEDGITGALKGWYCNFTRPAILDNDSAAADDLALDAFVSPVDRALLVLDLDEYAALNLPDDERDTVEVALEELRRMAASRELPFND